jgi:N-acyl-phosphatidylethanolamine-hydrolysing phospholipase D
LKLNWEAIRNPPENAIQFTWIGHATFLIQMGGLNFLTDPLWSERCSPFQFAGPKRFRSAPCHLDELPKIDFVLVSHNHYDHLDYYVVDRLGEKTTWIVPKGQARWFRKQTISSVVELNWWDQFPVTNDFDVVATPCQHW